MEKLILKLQCGPLVMGSSKELFKYCFLMVIIFIRPYLEHDLSHGTQRGFQLGLVQAPMAWQDRGA